MQDYVLAGRYHYERLIGAGAMGQVWLAEDALLRRKVAVKSVGAAGVVSGLATPIRHDLLARIEREARLAARLNHANAVAVYDLVAADGRSHVVMEYVAGETLADAIAASGVLPADRVAAIGTAVADALAEAHRLGIVHRDVKPANILLDQRGAPKIADFGIARVTDDAATATSGLMLGTPAFVAPEVAHGAAATSASDVWSLGITLYAALEGRSPFQHARDDSPMAVLGRILSVTHTPRPSRGGAVADVVARMVHVRPEARPSAAEAAAALRAAAGSPAAAQPIGDDATTRGVPVPPPVLPPTEPRPRYSAPVIPTPSAFAPVPAEQDRRSSARPLLVGLAAAALVAVLVAAVLVILGGRDTTTAAAPPSSSSAVAASPAVSVATVTETHRGAIVTRTETSTAPPPATSSAVPATDTALYAYDSGTNLLRVPAPTGFYIEADTVEITRTSHWHDYVHADSEDRWHQPYLHIGVGNAKALADFAREVQDSVEFQSTNRNFTDIVVHQPVFTDSYCGTQAADVEYTETNRRGIPRHGKYRIWQSAGETLIIELDAPASAWQTWAPVFDTMTASCVTD